MKRKKRETMVAINYAKETDRGMDCLLQEHDPLEVIFEKTLS
ncbi:hypothetical protein [Paenibacillus apis]|nr:hypothetical protein [Paenibacillus apis]